MDPLAIHLKNIISPLYDRRLMILILKKYSHGRRAFSENYRTTKIKDEHRYRRHDFVARTYKKIKESNKEN